MRCSDKHDDPMMLGHWRHAAGRTVELGRIVMKSFRRMSMVVGAISALLAAGGPRAADNKVVIGDIDDMSGPYADVIGTSGVESIKMAIADFGGSALGQPIPILTF